MPNRHTATRDREAAGDVMSHHCMSHLYSAPEIRGVLEGTVTHG